jgi:dUTP pyrophosphatase
MQRGFEIVNDKHRKNKNIAINLPKRSDAGSAGYDFFTPVDLIVPKLGTAKFYTDIKAYMPKNETLLLFIRSSLGIKHKIILATNVSIIDSSYYSNLDNDGNIIVTLYNYGIEDYLIKKGERVVQGMFVNYKTVDNETLEPKLRKGGVGSTGR